MDRTADPGAVAPIDSEQPLELPDELPDLDPDLDPTLPDDE